MTAMNFAIHYIDRATATTRRSTDNLNALRVQPGDDGDASAATSSACGLSPRSGSTATPTTSAPRWSSSGSRSRTRALTIDVRARVVTRSRAEPPERAWEALRDPAYREAAASSCSQTDDAADTARSTSCWQTTRAARPRWRR